MQSKSTNETVSALKALLNKRAEVEPPRLNAEDSDDLDRLPYNVALDHIKKRHFNQRCGECGRFIGNHSSKQMKRCFSKTKTTGGLNA